MIALLNWRVWAAVALAVTLAASHWKAYMAGGASCREAVAVRNMQIANDALLASEENRQKEHLWGDKVRKAENDFQKKQAHNGVIVSQLRDGLRDFQATINSPASQDTTRAPGANGTGGLERELLGNCAAALVAVATEADRLENKVLGLQDYVKAVGLDK